MAKNTIYSGVEGIKAPSFEDYRKEGYQYDFEAHDKAEEEYVKQIQEFAKRKGKGKYKGKEFHIPMGDGAARYIVLSLSPVKLIHLPVGDAWDSPHASYIPASEIKQDIDGWEKLNELFNF